MIIHFKGDIPEGDKGLLNAFCEREDKAELKPLPLCSVVQLPNGNSYQYIPVPGETKYTYKFERITKWP